VRARADGILVLLYAGMLRFSDNDDELATVIAHELAHNILRHRARLNAANIQRGLAQNFGRNARLTRATEEEADRLSVWLMADAGYDPAAAARFWTNFGKRHGGGIFAAPTHPRWQDRVRSVTEEAAAMQRLRAADPLAIPPLVASPPPLE
jgi:predicted Zn-dependent protease